MWYGKTAPVRVQTLGQVACCAYNSDELSPTARSPIRLWLLGFRATLTCSGLRPETPKEPLPCRSAP